jgi:hypothetical protein
MKKLGACALLTLLLLAACAQARGDELAARQTAPTATTTALPRPSAGTTAVATTAHADRHTSTPPARTTPQAAPVGTPAYARTVLPPTALSRLARRHLSNNLPTRLPSPTPTPSATPVPDT